MLSVIGGKLTTCRSLAEETAKTLLAELHLSVQATTQDRALPGGQDHPAVGASLVQTWQKLSEQYRLEIGSIVDMWQLFGTDTPAVLQEFSARSSEITEMLPNTAISVAAARHAIRNEWAVTLSDLVERRLMLLYHQQLTLQCLRRLAALLAEEGRLDAADAEQHIQTTVARLQNHFGKRVSDSTD